MNTYEKYIGKFYKSFNEKGSHRYKSWEYCYRFFINNKEKLLNKPDASLIDIAALNLSFYLASWGMYRGSSFLLQTDYTVHKGAIETIFKEYYEPIIINKNVLTWKDNEIDLLFELKEDLENYYSEIRKNIIKSKRDTITDTLITKVLLGVLGVTPAYDRYFKEGLKSYNNKPNSQIPQTFNKQSFKGLINFAQNLKNLPLPLKIDHRMKYPLMKLVDMYFWKYGENLERNKKK